VLAAHFSNESERLSEPTAVAAISAGGGAASFSAAPQAGADAGVLALGDAPGTTEHAAVMAGMHARGRINLESGATRQPVGCTSTLHVQFPLSSLAPLVLVQLSGHRILKLLECGVPLKHRKAFISAFFHIVDAPTAAEERERWLAYVRFLNAEYPDLPRTPDGRNSVWIQYLLDNWMCTEWHCAFVLRVRNIVSHYLNNTTNEPSYSSTIGKTRDAAAADS
jgi:hypothetical protein